MDKILYGRELLLSEIPKEFHGEMVCLEKLESYPSYTEKSGNLYCKRCTSKMDKVASHECLCQEQCAYCRNCLQMGKVRACSVFYHLPEKNAFQLETANILKWESELSIQQQEAAQTIVTAIKNKETRLLWAVAGAGKTEMLFEGLAYALKNGKRVCIATPRVDVALELAPRLQQAFPTVQQSLLYGEMVEPYEYRQLVICTTHQLFRFKEAFDVLIIDEIDAFPFHLDKTLQFAANKARKEISAMIYLSATPDQSMQKEIKQNKLEATILPARYHGYKLPVPQTMSCSDWRKQVLQHFLKTSFGKEMNRRIENKRRFLIFAPNIEWMAKLEEVMRKHYPHTSFAMVYAEDPHRKEKVMKMREGQVQFLISTTILERGVTFPNIDVFVIGAEDRIFTESALVQMAGRCGRAASHPMGDVIFFHDGQSLAMKKAIKQIKTMNKLAKKRGLIE